MKAHELALLLLKRPNAEVYIEWPTGDNCMDGYSHASEIAVLDPTREEGDEELSPASRADDTKDMISLRAAPLN